MRLKVITTLLIVFALGFKIEAQEPYAQSLTVSDGLPSDAIYSILEDSKGYIWITCNEGLYRYDGKTFKCFKAANQNSFAGSALMEDRLGRIWYQNFDGECYYVQNERSRPLDGYEKGTYLEQAVTEKHLFVYEKNAIVVFDLKTLKRIKHFDLGDLLTAPKSASCENIFYYISEGYLFQVNEDLIPMKISKVPDSFLPQYKMVAHPGGVCIQATGNSHPEIWEYSNSKRTFTKKYSLPGELVIQNLSFCDNRLWVQSTKGIYVFNEKDPTDCRHYFASHNFSDQIKDRKNNYWFTSPTAGILIVPEFNTNFYELEQYKGLKFLIQDDENVLVSTQNDEILELNVKTAEIKELYKGVNNAEIYYLYQDQAAGNFIFVASDGNTYFAQNGNLKNRIFFNHAIKQVEKVDHHIYTYVSSGAFGFIVFPGANPKSPWLKDFLNIEKETKNGITIYLNKSHLRCRALLYDSLTQNIYFSSTKSCFVYNKGKFIEIQPGNPIVNFTKFFRIGKRILAVSVNGKIYEIKADFSCVDISPELGLENVFVQQAKFIQGYLIVKTQKNILMIRQTKKNTFVQTNFFDKTNQVCTDFTLCNGFVWILTNRGLIQWNHQAKHNTTTNGKWLIDYAMLNDRQFEWQREQAFPYGQNNFFLRFSILDFGVQTVGKMQYRINHSTWKDIAFDVRTLNLPALSTGKHTIELKAHFLNGRQDTQTIVFTILKPFWMTIWFYILIFSLCLGIIIFGFRHQISQIRLRNSLMNEKVNLESDLNKSLLASIKSQMNPHFIFNALNTIQAYIYMNDKKNATGYLSKFSKLTRHILEFSEKDKVPLSEEINALQLYLELEKMRFQEDFNYHVTQEKIDISGIKIPSMLIQPYVENAIKHGLLHLEGKKELNIHFSVKESILTVEIEDNGIGRKKSAEINVRRAENHKSFSTKANEQRLKLLNKDMEVGVEIIDKYSDLQQVFGTKVILRIKIES